MASRPVTYVDVFAERPLEGNALAVVHDADGLDSEVMLAFARETRLSETTFIQSPDQTGADYRNRIFDPDHEIEFAGHPSLGTAVAHARARQMTKASFVQQTGAGLQPIEVELIERAHWRASMLQRKATLTTPVDREQTMAAVGLDPADADVELPPQVGSTGLAHVLAPVGDPAALDRAVPDPAAIRELLAPHRAFVLYLFHHQPGSARVDARGFISDARATEDPATGGAAGPLCAYLAERRGTAAIEISQGVAMKRPSVIHAEPADDGIRVSGSVVPLIDGTIELPG